MNGLKQRVVGAVVLVSLAVIFIPMIFEEPHPKSRVEILPIPEKKEVPAFTIELPSAPERTKKPHKEIDSAAMMTGQAEIIDEGADEQTKHSQSVASHQLTLDSSKGSDDATRTPSRKTEITKNNEIEELDSSRLQKLWSVQIGTFKQSSSVIKIKEGLKKSGIPLYTQEISSGDVALVRVFAGPVESKKKASELKKILDKRYKVQSLVRKYKASPKRS